MHSTYVNLSGDQLLRKQCELLERLVGEAQSISRRLAEWPLLADRVTNLEYGVRKVETGSPPATAVGPPSETQSTTTDSPSAAEAESMIAGIRSSSPSAQRTTPTFGVVQTCACVWPTAYWTRIAPPKNRSDTWELRCLECDALWCAVSIAALGADNTRRT